MLLSQTRRNSSPGTSKRGPTSSNNEASTTQVYHNNQDQQSDDCVKLDSHPGPAHIRRGRLLHRQDYSEWFTTLWLSKHVVEEKMTG